MNITNLPKSYFTVNVDKTKVKASSSNAAFQLFNEGITKGPDNKNEWPLKPNIWYNIQSGYGMWVLENEFPNTKGGELILVNYL